jgi:hypothetical protein
MRMAQRGAARSTTQSLRFWTCADTSLDGGFFVFGDISARKLGTYKLRFSLFDTAK